MAITESEKHTLMNIAARNATHDARVIAELTAKNVKLQSAARKLLDCLVPGIVLTIGGCEIDHSGINDAKAELEDAVKQL